MSKVRSKSTRIWSIICIIFLVGATSYTLYQNHLNKEILSQRDTTLDLGEYTKLWVIEDLKLLFSIKDDNTYKTAKQNMHLTDELRTKLLSNSYDSIKDTLVNADKVGFIDAQYTLINDKSVYYVLADIYRGTEIYSLNALIYVDNNLISNIIVY